MFSISTLEALVQQGGSWHSEETQISHLKCKRFLSVSFSLEFALLHGRRSITIILSISFKKERTWSCHLCLSRCPFSLGSVFHQPYKRTQGPLVASAGEPCVHPEQAPDLAGGPSTAVPLLERTCPPSEGACRCLRRPDQLPRPGRLGPWRLL